jgi:hypothetical protein
MDPLRRVLLGATSFIAIGCGGAPKVLTEDDKKQLQQVRVIELDIASIHPRTPIEHARSIVVEKIKSAGLVVARKGESADAELDVFLDLVRPAGTGTVRQPDDSLILYISVRLDHKRVGRVFDYWDHISPPYTENLSKSELVRDLDYILKLKLHKPSAMACQTDADCSSYQSCRSRPGGGTECRIKSADPLEQPRRPGTK